MRTIALLVVLLGLFGSSIASSPVENCVAVGVNYTYFTLCPFAQDPIFNLTINSGMYAGENLALALGKTNVPGCTGLGQDDVYATLNPNATDCVNVAVSGPNYTLVQAGNATGGLQITFPAEIDPISHLTNQVVVNLLCDATLTQTNETVFTAASTLFNGTEIITVTGTSRYGCPTVSFNGLIDFIANNQVMFAVFFGVVGVVLVFFGLKLVNFAVFIISATVGTLGAADLFFEFTSIGTEQWLMWVIFFICLVAGLALGVLALKFEKFSFFIVGASLGVVGGLMLYNGVVAPFVSGEQLGTAPLYIVCTICALICGGIAFFIFEDILIIATAVIGSYMSVRALAVFIGGFPNESDVANGISSFSASAYAYLAGILILAALGMCAQYSMKPKKDEEGYENLPQAQNYYRY
jgi:hypothetical protein